MLGAEDYLLFATVALLPWAFGGVEMWAYRSAALLLVVAGCIALWKRGFGGWGLGKRDSRWLLPAFLLALWAAVQWVPLPPGVVRILSPQAHRIYSEALPGYGTSSGQMGLEAVEAKALERVPEARGVPLPGEPAIALQVRPPSACPSRWRSVSLQPGATQERLFWYVSLLVGFLVIGQRTSDTRVHAIYRIVLFGAFALLAIFALVQDRTWNGKLYWVRPLLTTSSKPFGPYVNPNHFGGLMELAVPWMAGRAASYLKRFGWEALRRADFAGCAGAAAICLVAGLSSASKMTTFMLGLSLSALGVLAVRGWRARSVVAGIAIVGLTAGAWLLSDTRVAERFQSYVERVEGGQVMATRVIVWQSATPMLRDFALAGSGFGTFREVFAYYIPRGSHRRWAQAHNDYLECVIEGGVVAGLLLLWLAWGYGSRVLRAQRSSAQESLGRLGLLLGIAALSLHAFVDFNHQMPANALLFVALCAMALAAASRGEQQLAADR